MRKATILGKDIYLKEKEYKRLLSRFNPRNFKYKKWDRIYKNSRGCYLCKLYYDKSVYCSDCPFEILRSPFYLGCMRAIHSILTKRERRYFIDNMSIGFDSIYYREGKCEKLIDKVYSEMRNGFKKVRTK